MKKSKAKLITRILEENGIDVKSNKAGFHRAKKAYNSFSHKSKARVI